MSSVFSRIPLNQLGLGEPAAKRQKLNSIETPRISPTYNENGTTPAEVRDRGIQNVENGQRLRSESQDTMELPDDSFWARGNELLGGDDTILQARQDQAKKAFDWRAYTADWAAHNSVPWSQSSLCLAPLQFIFSGHLPSLYRNSARILLQQHGGGVSKTIGPHVGYAVVGKDGSRKKMKTIQEQGIEILGEAELLKLIKERWNTTTEFHQAQGDFHTAVGGDNRSRTSSSDSSEASPFVGNLDAVEAIERQQRLQAAREAVKSIETLSETGLDLLSDSQLRDLICTIVRYTFEASSRFEPESLKHLRLEGVGRGLATKYQNALGEAKLRGLELDKFIPKMKKNTATIVSRRPLVKENRNAISQSDTLNGTGTSTEEPRMPGPPSHSPSQEAQAAAPQRSSTAIASDRDIVDKLPEEARSTFWCTQCRRGPAICMHTHRMVGHIMKNLDDTSFVDLLFARYLLEEWDTSGQDDFGIEAYYRRHHQEAHIKQERASWLHVIRARTDKQQSELPEGKRNRAVELLKGSIDCFVEKGSTRRFRKMEGQDYHKALRDEETRDPKIKLRSEAERSSRHRSRESRAARSMGNHHIKRPARNPGGKKARDSGVDLDEDGLEDLPDDMSICSEDSLLETPPPSLGQILLDTPKHRLSEISQQILSKTSQPMLARFIKAACAESASTRELTESLLNESSTKSNVSDLMPSPVVSSAISQISNSGNLIDQIAPSEDATDGVKCTRCSVKFDPATPRAMNECSYHDGRLAWRANGKPIDNTKLVSKMFSTHTFYSCCNCTMTAPGCKHGTHLVSLPEVEGSDPKDSPSPLHSIELAPTTSSNIKGPLDRERSKPLATGLLESPIEKSNTVKASGSVGGRSTSTPEEGFRSIPNYAPEIPKAIASNQRGLLELIKDSEYYRTTNIRDLSLDPHASLLCSAELELAGNLRWPCSIFLLRKRQLFKTCLECWRAEKVPTATAYSVVARGSNMKNAAIFNAYKRAGLLDREHFDKQPKLSKPPSHGVEQPVESPSGAEPLARFKSGSMDYYKTLHAQASNGSSPTVQSATATASKQGAGPIRAPASAFGSNPPRRPSLLVQEITKSGAPAPSTPQSVDTTKIISQGSHSEGNTPGGRVLLPMPRTWKEATVADRKMVELKRQGLTWHEIWPIWRQFEPEALKDQASLAMRYSKLKKEFQDEWDREAREGKL